MSVARNHFDRSKPFYPLVVNYLASLHGLKSVLLEGILVGNPAATKRDVSRFIQNPDSADNELKKGITKLIGPLELVCNCGEAPVVVDHDFLAKEYADNNLYLLETVGRHAAGALLILAWEGTKSIHDKTPLWEFLRHSRHAAAHNGRWHFLNGEPKALAEWKSFKLDASMHGKALFQTPNEPGMLRFGDPLNLLWDIEQAYPELKV